MCWPLCFKGARSGVEHPWFAYKRDNLASAECPLLSLLILQQDN